jgi:hypothetical protein
MNLTMVTFFIEIRFFLHKNEKMFHSRLIIIY